MIEELLESVEPISYSATAWGEEHCYEIGDCEIRYWMTESSLSFLVKLTDIKSVSRKKQTHRFFRAGLVGLVAPAIMFVPVLLKEGSLSNIPGRYLFFAAAACIVGLLAVLRYRKRHTLLQIHTKTGDLLGVYENENDSATFEWIQQRLADHLQKSTGSRPQQQKPR